MLVVVLTLLALLQVPTQIPLAASRRFEVASVKLNKPHGRSGVTGDCHGTDSNLVVGEILAAIPRGRCVVTAARLSHLIGIAYGLPMARISGGPEFVWGVERYDIEATSGNADSTHEQLHEMLRNLMADRFQLKFHIESKQVNGHAIYAPRNGLKLKPSKSEKRSIVRVAGAAINKFDAVDGKNTNLNTVIAEGITIAEFVRTLANLPDVGPLVDKTELSGVYDITLSWEPGESLARVMQEELGLRLETEKVPLDYFIIDSAEKPSEN
jgi:uncharacterized protein (TIGR03435 family)